MNKKIIITIVIIVGIALLLISIISNIKSNPWNICVNKQKGLGYTTSEAYKYCAEQGY